MKKFKKLAVLVTAIGVLGAGGAVYAASSATPADIVSGLTGKTVQEFQQERATGKTYGTIAKDAGKLDEFKAQMLEQKKEILKQRVKEGRLTQEQADKILNAIKNNQANCDGNNKASIGKKYGAGFGQGNGMGKGAGMRNGNGMRIGRNINK